MISFGLTASNFVLAALLLDKVLKDVDPVDLGQVAVDLDSVAQTHRVRRSWNQTAAAVVVVVVAAAAAVVVVDDGL